MPYLRICDLVRSLMRGAHATRVPCAAHSASMSYTSGLMCMPVPRHVGHGASPKIHLPSTSPFPPHRLQTSAAVMARLARRNSCSFVGRPGRRSTSTGHSGAGSAVRAFSSGDVDRSDLRSVPAGIANATRRPLAATSRRTASTVPSASRTGAPLAASMRPPSTRRKASTPSGRATRERPATSWIVGPRTTRPAVTSNASPQPHPAVTTLRALSNVGSPGASGSPVCAERPDSTLSAASPSAGSAMPNCVTVAVAPPWNRSVARLAPRCFSAPRSHMTNRPSPIRKPVETD
jgi:hypothetical protein